MKTNLLGRIFPVFGIVLLGWATLARAAAPEAPEVVPLGDNTYRITRQAKFNFVRNTEKLKAQVKEDAARFCDSHGKVMKVVSITEEKPTILHGGVAKAQIVFQALDAGSPEPKATEPTAPVAAPLAAPVPAPVATAVAAPAVTPVAADEKPVTIGSVNADLGLIEDLHKRGVLLDAEYAAAKQRLLDRLK